MTAVDAAERAGSSSTSGASASQLGSRSIRARIVMGAMVVGVVPLVAIGVAAYLWQRTAITDRALDQLESVAAIQEARLDAYFAMSEDLLTDLARNVSLNNSLYDYVEHGDIPALLSADRILAVTAGASPRILALGVVGTDGQILTSERPPPVALVDEQFMAAASVAPVVGVMAVDEEGTVLHISGAPLAFAGRSLGTIVVAESMEPVFAVVGEHSGLRETGETIVALRDEAGNALFVAPLRFDPGATLNRVVPATATDVPITSALAGVEAVFEDAVDYRGVPVLAATGYLSEPDWGLVVKMDIQEARAPVRRFGFAALVGVTLSSLIVVLLALVFGRRTAGPIRQLTDTAIAISRGDRDRRASVRGKDEIAQLAGAFNAMTDEMALLTGSLERKVADRTAQLEARQRELESLVQHKEAFVATVSHELRTPLSSVLASIELLTDSSFELDDSEKHEVLRLAAQEASEISNLIEDLLVAARAEAGSLQVTNVPVHLRAQVAQVLEGLDRAAAGRVEVSGDAGRASADPARVRQIVRNLLTNAFRYGGPHVEVRLSMGDGWSSVEVRDDGDGIPLEDRERVFDAYQAASAGRRAPGSIGLGLAISRELARLMGGALDYRYVDDNSVFELRLPTLTATAT